jgi:DNA-binding NarL/FixJ family response regulator
MGQEGPTGYATGATDAHPWSVLVADDAPLVREMTAELIAGDDCFIVVAQADDTRSAIDAAEGEHPDVAVLDVHMPGGGGVVAAARIAEVSPDTRVVAYSVYDDATSRDEMRDAGAVAYVVKGRDALLEVLRQVCRRPAGDGR